MTHEQVQWLEAHNAGMTRRFLYSVILAVSFAGVLVSAAPQADQPPLTFRVDDSQVLVLVHDFEGDRLGSRLGDVSRRYLVLDKVACGHAVGGIRRLAVHEYEVALDQPCGGRAAEIRALFGEEAIEAGRRGGRDQAASQ